MRTKVILIDPDRWANMSTGERHDVNFVLNLCYLYKKQGIKKTDSMLMALGTDVRTKSYVKDIP